MSLKSHYFLQKVSDTTNSGRPHSIWAFQILGICKTYCNQISIWTRHTTCLYSLIKISLDHGSQTSNPCFLKKNHLFKKMDSLFCFTVIGNLQAVIYVTKWYLSLSHFRCSQCSPLARRS